MDARALILRILGSLDRPSANLDRTVDAMLRTASLDMRDRRFVFEIVYGVVRRKLTLDYLIDRLLDSDSLKKNAPLRRVLQVGLYQIIFMDRVPDHAAVNESVKLAKADRSTRAISGVVNGVLRKALNDRRAIEFPDPKATLEERLSIEYSHPRWMVERWLKNFGLSSTKQLLSFNNERPDIFLRRVVRNLSRPQFESQVRAIGDPATGYLNLYYRLKKNMVLENVAVFRQGLCTVQSPSSGWVVALVEARKGEKILDICAAPGGKTTMLSEFVGEEGAVCASDTSWRRIKMLKDTLHRMHLSNVHLFVGDGKCPPIEGVFDKILIDAPCSATGVLHRHPDARWVRTAGDIADGIALQRALLESAARLVGRGGTIVYATCSLEPEENEQQVHAFLNDHPEFVHAGCPGCVPQNYIDDNGFLAIRPFLHGIDGMFGARLVKAT